MSTDFWTRSSRYGLVHKAAAPPANPEALVVYVHGVFGNCRRTWGRMPQWVLDATGLDLDVVSFSYPSSPGSGSRSRRRAAPAGKSAAG